MYSDPRGGGNKKKINTNFFKKWSNNMAYVLGLIMADGTIEDARKSSRTCYIALTSKDEDLINQVKRVMSSKHNLGTIPNHITSIKDKSYISYAPIFRLRIGNKNMYQDLVNLGITPRKSLRLNLPNIPNKYFKFLLRGYFDGDGCTNIYQKRLTVIFTSGCRSFLKNLSIKITSFTNSIIPKLYFNSGAYRLVYRGKNAKAVLKFMYSNLTQSPYLERKYILYKNFITN